MDLVTGATGFLGSVIARTLLARGRRVRALRRANSRMDLLGEDASRIDWVECDVLDVDGLVEALVGIETIYHAAAVVAFRRADRLAMLRVNAGGTANLVNAALETGVPRFLHISSVSTLGPSAPGKLADESSTWEDGPRTTDYGLSKHLAEREAWRGAAEGLQVGMINPGTIVGGGFWNQGTARFFSRVDEGLGFYTDGSTGFVDVRDVAEAACLVVERERYDERFVIVGENRPYRAVMNRISERLDRPPPARRIGPTALAVAWRLESLKARLTGGRPDLTRQTARIIGQVREFSNARFVEAFDYRFRPLDTTLDETAACYREARSAERDFGILALTP